VDPRLLNPLPIQIQMFDSRLFALGETIRRHRLLSLSSSRLRSTLTLLPVGSSRWPWRKLSRMTYRSEKERRHSAHLALLPSVSLPEAEVGRDERSSPQARWPFPLAAPQAGGAERVLAAQPLARLLHFTT
jgi:hypothetical protein